MESRQISEKCIISVRSSPCFEIVNFSIRADISMPEKVSLCGAECGADVDSVPKFLIKRSDELSRREIALTALARYVDTYVREYNTSVLETLLYAKLRPPALVFDETEKLVLNSSRSCA
jgi:hypothetical protein